MFFFLCDLFKEGQTAYKISRMLSVLPILAKSPFDKRPRLRTGQASTTIGHDAGRLPQRAQETTVHIALRLFNWAREGRDETRQWRSF